MKRGRHNSTRVKITMPLPLWQWVQSFGASLGKSGASVVRDALQALKARAKYAPIAPPRQPTSVERKMVAEEVLRDIREGLSSSVSRMLAHPTQKEEVLRILLRLKDLVSLLHDDTTRNEPTVRLIRESLGVLVHTAECRQGRGN